MDKLTSLMKKVTEALRKVAKWFANLAASLKGLTKTLRQRHTEALKIMKPSFPIITPNITPRR